MQKRLLSFVVLVSLAIAACQKEDANLTQTATQTGLQTAQTTTSLTSTEEATLRGGGGCDSATVKAITFGELPPAAQKWLLTNGDTSKIKKYASITCPDGTVTYVAGGSQKVVRFDSTGAVIGGPTTGGGGPSTGNGPCKDAKYESIAATDLPAEAQTYLTTHQVDLTKVKIVKITCPDGTVTYQVSGQGGSVRFDATGTVIGGNIGGGNTGGNNGPCKDAKIEAIAVTDLPADAQAWLTQHNVETTNSKIVKITCPDGTVTYGVIGKDGRIRFDSTGAVIGNPHIGGGGTGNNPCAGTAPEKITVADLPQAAQAWLAQYAANQEIKSVVKFTKPDCTIYYEVTLKTGKVIRFDKDGIKIQ